MDKKVYIVNYKETTTDGNFITEVESGTFDYAYDTEEEAIAVVADCGQKTAKELDSEYADGISMTENWSDNKDYCCITIGGDTYEYWVYMVTICGK